MGASILPDKDASGRLVNRTGAFASNATEDGKILYTKIHIFKNPLSITENHLR